MIRSISEDFDKIKSQDENEMIYSDIEENQLLMPNKKKEINKQLNYINKNQFLRVQRPYDMRFSKHTQSEITGASNELSLLNSIVRPVAHYTMDLSKSHRQSLKTLKDWNYLQQQIIPSYQDHMLVSYRKKENKINSYKDNKQFEYLCNRLQQSSKFKMKIVLIMLIIGFIYCYLQFTVFDDDKVKIKRPKVNKNKQKSESHHQVNKQL